MTGDPEFDGGEDGSHVRPALGERLHRFADELQARGLPVSMTERIDAMRAVQRVDLASSQGLHTALASTMIKSADHLAVFDEVYQLYFRGRSVNQQLPESPEREARSDPADEHPEPLDLDHALRVALSDGSESLARLVAEQAVKEFAQFEPGRRVAGLQYATRTVTGLRLNQTTDELMAAAGSALVASPGGQGGRAPAGGGGGGATGAPNSLQFGTELISRIEQEQIADRAERMRELIGEVIREMLVADRGEDAVAKTLRTPLAADAAIASASPAQLAEIERMLQPLQRKLATTMMRKRRRRAGPLDVRGTVRASMATGGVPIKVVHRRPTPTKPKLYVLADVSGSVATYAAFTITLVSAMASLYSRLRTFAFVENAVEVTHLFNPAQGGRSDPRQALAEINRVQGLNFYDARTDYGRTLRHFYAEVGEELDRRSTVLIFGDARGNYRPAHEETLAHIKRRAGAVYWLNPEWVPAWGSGDSLMPVYAPHCTAAVSCRSLNDLRRFIEGLD
ncbi:hypothetical protein SAMN05892883_1671 [Jatrophihabitans sp. GAS493]|uniref:VWA domain-containing protein n=1 Tax=Jatrophihabitans sp. GAS493 TaxID=1907575 RepID=UPI000BB7D1C8|nr:VWA domain-containing protein [Jatrophihabitans sp. GAS493]SOD72262.1 hypothetical protein SAMN05892883_1671 [Jatrophihabitans sp. GAS493]